MKAPIYLPSGLVESIILSDGASHEEDQAVVKELGAVMWGPLEDTDDTQSKL